ncbi:MAG: TIGR00730 family Rossman fold protein [Chthoniobacterales bacterium]
MNEKETAAVKELVEASGCVHSPELIQELVATALLLGRDKAPVADLKLFVRSLKELRYASKVFQPYSDRRKVAVFGSARLAPETDEFKMAEELARKVVEHGFMVITGGGDGIMGAAQKGAGRENSFGLNIRLPFEQRANETIHGDKKLINFNYFFTRKVNFVKETDAFVLFPGGFGTQDEGFECLTLMQTGKTKITPLVLLDTTNGRYWETWEFFVRNDLLRMKLISPSDFHLFKISHSCEEAIEHIQQFYRVFDSYRWLREKMVIRVKRPLTAASVAELNTKFRHTLVAGDIEQTSILPEEDGDRRWSVGPIFRGGQEEEMPRLVLTPKKTDFGTLRLLIDAINESATEG